MSRTSAKGPSFWVDNDGKVMQVIDGQSVHIDTLDPGELFKMRNTIRVGSSTYRYTANPVMFVRPRK
jgi:hypothetical protein